MSKPFLESYRGQTIQQLITMRDSHRVDSLVLAVEQALSGKPKGELSSAELVILAVEALEREVNNGGYEQFFVNSSRQFAIVIVPSLQSIGCPKVAGITTDAISALGLPEKFDSDMVERAALTLSEDARNALSQCDSRYYDNDDEYIDQHLFSYIEQHQSEIQIPKVA